MDSRSDEGATGREATSMTNAEIAAKCSPCIYATPCDDGIVQKCRNCEQQPAITAALDAKDAQFREFTERGGRLLIEVEAERDKAHAAREAINTRWQRCREVSEDRRVAFIAAEQKLRDVTRTLDEACADADAAEALTDRYRVALEDIRDDATHIDCGAADWNHQVDCCCPELIARTALKGTASAPPPHPATQDDGSDRS